MIRIDVPRVAVAALMLWALGGCGGGVMPPIRSEAERLDVARQMLADKDYLRASELLQSYITNNPGGAHVDEAIYLLGDSHLRMKDWAAAQIEFERLLQNYPESDSGAAASFKLGEALFGQARGPDFDQEFTRQALTQWQRYLSENPGHWLNQEAEQRITKTRVQLATKYLNTANLYAKMKQYEPAEIYYKRVIDEFGDTPQGGDARIGMARLLAARGWKQQAIDQLRAIETEFAGQPLATAAARERQRLEH
jgi:outer membrane protein assembly factor BamD